MIRAAIIVVSLLLCACQPKQHPSLYCQEYGIASASQCAPLSIMKEAAKHDPQ